MLAVNLFFLKRKALIHSGWRGALQDIAVRAIDIFRMKGSKLSNLKIILSPMIRELVIGQDTIWEFEEYIEKKVLYITNL